MRFLLGVADFARWPFERFAWLLERWLIWPLRERSAGWGPSGGAIGAGALAALAAAAVVVGVLWAPGDGGSGKKAAVPTPVAIATPTGQPRAEEPQGPVLKGTPPTFHAGGAGVATAAKGAANGASGETSAGDEAGSGAAPLPEATAASSSATSVPAGPEAMKIARRFSEAFVFYEVGERSARAKTVFGETAIPRLATALAERSPRLPESGKVPKARVVNLVAGPRSGKAYTVSVSLLRVGLTSELRLEMKKSAGNWLVTDVRG